ncbi:MAG: GtrA family protein [Actinobacteria bacterium]|nr:GtrA family protein [Actinomycetota bacterium]
MAESLLAPRRGALVAVRSRRLRLGRFAVVGAVVMAAGALLLVALVELAGMSPHLAYLIQALFSIEASFVLSRAWTWSDRRATGRRGIAGEWLRFHTSRLLTVPANQGFFSLLVGLGVGYLAANAIGIAVSSAVNFVVAHHLVFRSKEDAS